MHINSKLGNRIAARRSLKRVASSVSSFQPCFSDHLVSSNPDTEDDQVLKMSDSEANDQQTHPDLEKSEPTNIHPLAGDEWPKLKDHVAEEHLDLTEASDSDDQPLDIKKSHPPEEEHTNKRKTRRGTKGKGRKIVYNKEKHPNDKRDGQSLHISINMLLSILSLLALLLGDTSAQTVVPLEGEIHVSEGDNVTLSCNYSNHLKKILLQLEYSHSSLKSMCWREQM
ncbi:hypothetical protein SRHO_G00019430 [Serrasalmus rhombeus]